MELRIAHVLPLDLNCPIQKPLVVNVPPQRQPRLLQLVYAAWEVDVIECTESSRSRKVAQSAVKFCRTLLENGKTLLRATLFTIAWGLSFLLQWLPFRFYSRMDFWQFIGHAAAEPDCFVKQGILKLRPSFRGIMLAPSRVANVCLLNYWRKYIYIIQSPFLCAILKFLAIQRRLAWHGNYAEAINTTPEWPEIQAKWGSRSPLLQLTEAHRRAGQEKLREWGVPEGAWYVCVHCREGGYDRNNLLHSLRNASIEDFLPAMRAIVARGGWCIRMGDPTMKPLSPEPGIIDYAHHHDRCDWMDVYLSADCRFFLGTASGLYVVGSVFGVPAVIVNQALPVFCHGYGFRDIFIPKLLWSHKLLRFLTFPEISASAFGNARFPHCFENTGIEVRDNTTQEISDAVMEMLEEIEGRFDESDQDRQLQASMQSLFRPGHYSYGAVSRVSRSFLRKHRGLVIPDTPSEIPRGSRPECGNENCSCLGRS